MSSGLITYSADMGTAGIWRAKVVKLCSDGRVDVFIPGLQGGTCPFVTKTVETTSNGTTTTETIITNEVKSEYTDAGQAAANAVLDPSDPNYESELEYVENTAAMQGSLPTSTDLTDRVETAQATRSKSSILIKANVCAWQLRTPLMPGDVVWVMFEGGNSTAPVIIGQLGNKLATGSMGVGGMMADGLFNDGYSPGTSLLSDAEKQAVVSKIISILSAAGWNKARIAAALANIQYESGFNPAAYNPNDKGLPAFGLIQWRDDRLRALMAYCNATSIEDLKSKATIEVQMAFMMHEMNGSEFAANGRIYNAAMPNTLEAARSAGVLWASEYERCDSKTYSGRGNLATEYFNMLGDDGASIDFNMAGTTTPAPAGGAAMTGDMNAWVASIKNGTEPSWVYGGDTQCPHICKAYTKAAFNVVVDGMGNGNQCAYNYAHNATFSKHFSYVAGVAGNTGTPTYNSGVTDNTALSTAAYQSPPCVGDILSLTGNDKVNGHVVVVIGVSGNQITIAEQYRGTSIIRHSTLTWPGDFLPSAKASNNRVIYGIARRK